jgi:putative nucleotidyltransferase with HDIG domain
MSLQAPSDGPSAAAEAGPDGLAHLVRERGAPLLEALSNHLPGAREHADGTALLAYAAALELRLDRARAETLREAARLHDIGKLYVPAELLVRDPAELSPAQAKLVEGHFQTAAALARGAGLPSTVGAWLTAVRERYDGRGPDKLAGEDIPLESRIIRAACGCDALIGYAGRDQESPELMRSFVESLRAGARTELDPRVVEALAAALDVRG